MDNRNDQEKQTRELNNISVGNQSALAKAHKRMDKLMNKQTDYEKRLRNARQDLDKTLSALRDQQSLSEKETQALEAIKIRQQNLGITTP